MCLDKKGSTSGPRHVDSKLLVVGGYVHDEKFIEDVGLGGPANKVELELVVIAVLLHHIDAELGVVIELQVIDGQSDIRLRGEGPGVGYLVLHSGGAYFNQLFFPRDG